MNTIRSRRILSALPDTLHTRLEIAKAIQTLAAQHESRPAQKTLESSLEIGALAASIVGEIFHELRKAGFNPNEPRVPAGSPDGGQWTTQGASGGYDDPRVISDAVPDNHWQPGQQYAANHIAGGGNNQGTPSGDAPDIPEEPPPTRQAINTFLKAAAYFLAGALWPVSRWATSS